MLAAIKEAVYGVIVISLASGILLGFQGKNSRMAPYVRYLLSLILVLMLLSPLLSVLSSVHTLWGGGTDNNNLGQNGTYDMDTYTRMTIDSAVNEAIGSAIYLLTAKTGIPSGDIDITLTVDDNDPSAVTITSVQVILAKAEHRIAADKIRAYMEETFLCPCTVDIKLQEDA